MFADCEHQKHVPNVIDHPGGAALLKNRFVIGICRPASLIWMGVIIDRWPKPKHESEDNQSADCNRRLKHDRSLPRSSSKITSLRRGNTACKATMATSWLRGQPLRVVSQFPRMHSRLGGSGGPYAGTVQRSAVSRIRQSKKEPPFGGRDRGGSERSCDAHQGRRRCPGAPLRPS